MPYSRTQQEDYYSHHGGWKWVEVPQRCGLEKKKIQQKETVYTLIDALADFLFNKKIDSVELFNKENPIITKENPIITKDDVQEAQYRNTNTTQNAWISLRSKLLDTFYSNGKTKRPCVVKMSLVPDTDKVNFIVTEYTVARYDTFENSVLGQNVILGYYKWDTIKSSVVIASMQGDPVTLLENLKKKLGEFEGDTFYQVVSVGGGKRDYMGIFTFDKSAAAAAAAHEL